MEQAVKLAGGHRLATVLGDRFRNAVKRLQARISMP
jgi:hypothetical protein